MGNAVLIRTTISFTTDESGSVCEHEVDGFEEGDLQFIADNMRMVPWNQQAADWGNMMKNIMINVMGVNMTNNDDDCWEHDDESLSCYNSHTLI